MKNKALVTSALLALGLISQAGAQNVVYVTGSTAFRTPVFNTILNLPGWSAAPSVAARGGSHANGDNGAYMLFHGSYKGADTYINCAWSGSEAGIASVAAPGANPVYFLLTSVSGVSSSQPSGSETNTVAQAPDLCFADTSQAVSLTLTPALTPMGTNSLTLPGTVGVVPFTWLKNKNSNPSNYWSAVTNITIPQARRLFSSPVFPALLTGNPTHTNNYVYLVGRNSFSGTHVNTVLAALEPTIVLLQQFSIGGFPNSAIGTVGTIDPNDPNPLDISSKVNNGYDGGGNVANALQCDGSCQANDPNTGLTGWMAVGYAGMGDATTARTGGAVWLSFNGVSETDGAVEEGQYSYWGYEHLYGRVGIGSGFQAVFGNDVAGAIPAQLGGSNPAASSSGINLNFMHAGKPSDAGDPFHFGQIF